MSNISDEYAMKEALTDVRRAYRLIYLYQERLYDIIKHIRESMGLKFYRWESNSWGLGRSEKDITDKPVWNGIPLYNFSILLLPETQNNKLLRDHWMLELRFLADRDVFDEETRWASFVNKDAEVIKGEARPEQFVCAEDSASVLWVSLLRMKSDQEDSVTWKNVWYSEGVEEFGKAEDMGEYYDGVMYAQEINLTDLQDDDSLNGVLEKFKEEARKELDLEEDFFTSE